MLDGERGREIPGYEDCYTGVIYATFAEMLADVRAYLQGSSAAYNWPVWIRYDEELPEESPGEMLVVSGTVEMGVFMQRHGTAAIWTCRATPAEVRQLQDLAASIWIHRIDAGLPR